MRLTNVQLSTLPVGTRLWHGTALGSSLIEVGSAAFQLGHAPVPVKPGFQPLPRYAILLRSKSGNENTAYLHMWTDSSLQEETNLSYELLSDVWDEQMGCRVPWKGFRTNEIDFDEAIALYSVNGRVSVEINHCQFTLINNLVDNFYESAVGFETLQQIKTKSVFELKYWIQDIVANKDTELDWILFF